MKVDLNLLHDQYNWLCKAPNTDHKDGLLNLIEHIFEKSETDLKSKRHSDTVYIHVRRIP